MSESAAVEVDTDRRRETAFHLRAMRESFADLLARLTGNPSDALWRRGDGNARGVARLRFGARGVRLADGAVVPWSESATRLPTLPALLAVARDHVRHALYAASSDDVRAVEEAIFARGLDVPSLFGDGGRVWYQSCPQHGTPACTYGDAVPRASCAYCRGSGYVTRGRAPSVSALLSLYVHGPAMQRVEAVAQGAARDVGAHVGRVAWLAVSQSDMAYYRRRGGVHPWAPVGVDVDVSPFAILALHGHDAVMAVEYL